MCCDVIFNYNVLVFIIIFSNSVKGELYELLTNQTTIFGRKFFTIYENLPYAAFLNIHYAQPPLADLRFKGSGLVCSCAIKLKTNILEALEERITIKKPPKGPQVMYKGIYNFSKGYTSSTELTEDLTLSVYMPISTKMTSFPVAVWLYEGSYENGPDFLIEEDILVVKVNFRASILGFLNTNNELAKGNMGAKDILISLKWIRSNIYLFNGDLNKVTVMGSGDAANIVASLLVSSAAEDLFKRVIIQGGSALSPVDYGSHNHKVVNKLYQRIYGNSDKINREKLYQYLSEAPVETLMAISNELFDSTEIRDRQQLIKAFGCTIEKDKKGAFMYKHPLEIYKRKLANYDVDVIFGYCNYDALFKLKHFVMRRRLLKYLNYNFQYLLPFFGDPDVYDSKRYRNIKRRIKDFYFINGTITERSLRRYVKYHTDQVIYPLVRQARLQTFHSRDVYLYRFSYNSCFNIKWASLPKLNWSGSTSGDEICYQFKCKSFAEDYNSAENVVEKRFIKKITRLLANFIKFGKPTPKIKDSTFEGLLWEPIRVNQTLKVLSIGKTFKMVSLPEQNRIDFWDKLKEDLFEDNA